MTTDVAQIGEAAPLNGPVTLAPYDPAWSAQYEELASAIRGALGGQALLLEHVGSTSVQGLSAKPVIDIVLAVADSANEAAYAPLLEQCGYELRLREPEWFQHRLLQARTIASNLHVFSAGCEEIARMVTFRNWLRREAQDRELYEHVKRALAVRVWRYTQDYADAKSDVVREIMVRASAAARA